MSYQTMRMNVTKLYIVVELWKERFNKLAEGIGYWIVVVFLYAVNKMQLIKFENADVVCIWRKDSVSTLE